MFHHIYFSHGLKKDSSCWEEGYMSTGTVGPLSKITISTDKKENITIASWQAKNGVENTVNETLSRDDFIEKYAEILKIDPTAFSEILQMSAFHKDAEDNLSDEGTLIIRRGADYAGEINIADVPKPTLKLLKNIRVSFKQSEKKLGSGDFQDSEEVASAFIPLD